jgi:hypothetical protein
MKINDLVSLPCTSLNQRVPQSKNYLRVHTAVTAKDTVSSLLKFQQSRPTDSSLNPAGRMPAAKTQKDFTISIPV